MLTPTEAAARNRQIALRNDEKILAKLEEVREPIVTRKAATRSNLPTIEPSKRAWKRPPHVAKAKRRSNVALPVSTPTPIVRNEQVNGITSFHQTKRVTQYAIDIVKVARYLAK